METSPTHTHQLHMSLLPHTLPLPHTLRLRHMSPLPTPQLTLHHYTTDKLNSNANWHPLYTDLRELKT